jgi:hypothetical protein
LINWDWKLKVKTNKTYIKGPKTKHRNQKNNDWSWNIINKKIQIIMFRGGGKKKAHQWTTSTNTRHSTWKRTWCCFQQHNRKISFDTGGAAPIVQSA